MYIHNFEPVLFQLGFLSLRWYSLAYIFGILLGWWYGKKIIIYLKNNYNLILDLKDFDELITYIIISIIVGGRLGYVIFYDLSFFLNNILEIFKIWNGGMSFHGGLIGIIIGIIIFAKKRDIKIFLLFDIISVVAPIGIFFGRIANFINSELYGKPTDFFFAVVFPKIDMTPRHPSQLYEAFLEGLILFLILSFFIFFKKYKYGFSSCLFLIFYGSFRIISETFREPDAHIGYLINNISMGSLLSFFMVIFGFLLLLILRKYEIK
ncbi:MAG: prolipoprotein diacylglyceryl transferase [Pelagibacteraceae bacterium TMED216]|nr:MAG: prolipoprotein diacylglyceryl transferase [Pelagibacteraceae bacterium TMED216]|tara:strand:+ start:7978 stop:8772 length:795 start_codon:yes stop_codon:yes gene_type:complete